MVTRNIRGVVEEYTRRQQEGTLIRHGFALDSDERQRRFVVQSLLYDGLELADFRSAFECDAREVFAPQWEALAEEGCLRDGERLSLSARGVRHADVVGQLFFSQRVRRLMAEYEYDT
jgi:oxygen-independent coproporphyrinogen-3 oxidase